jgi:hypothetical protein
VCLYHISLWIFELFDSHLLRCVCDTTSGEVFQWLPVDPRVIMYLQDCIKSLNITLKKMKNKIVRSMSSKSAKHIEGCQHVGYCYFVKEIWRDAITLLSKLRW